MIKTLLIFFIPALIYARSYPQYKQCHKSWENQKMGTTDKTICQEGSILSCAAMGLYGIGMKYNPSTLNEWMKTHGGYIHGNQFVWASMNSLSMVYEGKISNYLLEKKINEGYVVFCRVNNGSHYVLAHSHFGDKIHANDPTQNKTSYLLTQVDDGESAIFRPENPQPDNEKPQQTQYIKISQQMIEKRRINNVMMAAFKNGDKIVTNAKTMMNPVLKMLRQN